MKLQVTIQLLKFCAQVFNAIFLVLGLSVAGCAVWILFGSGSFLTVLPSEELRTVGAGLLLIGGVVVMVSVIGCVGADRENRFLLLLYTGFLIVLVLGQLFVILLLLISRDKIEQSLDETVDRIIRHYEQDSDSQDRLMDSVQHYGECCGRTDPADWLKNSYIESLNLTNPHVLPCSCFSSYRPVVNSSWCSELLNFTAPLFGRGNDSYDQGCKKKLSDWLQENALTIVGMAVGLTLIQMVQFGIMVYLYRTCGRKAALKRTSSLADPDHDHPDHKPEDDPDHAEQNDGYTDPEDGYVDPAHLAYHHDNQNDN